MGTRGDAVGSTLDVDGHPVALTNLDRVLYPATGTTKADVIAYYLAVSRVLLPHVHDRPVTRRRWPDGVEAEGFFEKNLPAWAPDWLSTVELPHRDRSVRYPLLRTRADLVWTAQAGALELHVPQWRVVPDGAGGGRGPADRLVLDLDPGPPAGLAECAEVALWLRARLRDDGAETYPVTSGSKGIQVYAHWPVPGAVTEEPSAYARALALELAGRFPRQVVATMTRSDRAGRILVDWSQNNPAKTTIAPYSLRGRAQPTVAAPRTWDEVERGGLEQLTIVDVTSRTERIGDPIGGLAPWAA